MSAVFKRIERRNAFISPYTAHKTFTFTSSSFGEVGIEWKRGVSGSFPYSEEALVHAGINQIMFKSHGQTSTEYNWTSSLGNEVNVLSIPRNLYGTSIKPGSVNLTVESESLVDDNGYILSGSSKVGYISYSKGIIAFTDSGYESLGAFNSSSAATLSFGHIQTSYLAYTHSISLDPSQDVNPFEAGGATPNQEITFLSESFDFSDLYIYGAGDIDGIGSAYYLAPKITLTIGGQSSVFFAREVDDQTSGKLTLDFLTNLTHPSVGTVDLSSNDYAQFTSIELELKHDPPGDADLTNAFLPTGSWTSSLSDYPESSSYFEILDDYTATVDTVQTTRRGQYITALSQVPRSVVEFTSSSIEYTYSGGEYTASYQASEPILTHTYHCHVDPNEFTLSYNPSLRDNTKVSGSLLDFATGSEFRPYATAVGLYNSVGELVAVGKLSEATPILKDTPYTFVVQLDI